MREVVHQSLSPSHKLLPWCFTGVQLGTVKHQAQVKQMFGTIRIQNWPSSRGIITATVPRRNAVALILSSYFFSGVSLPDAAFAEPSVGLREYIDTFDGYSFKYPQNWIQVRGAGADIFFRDPYILDENISVEMSSPSSSKYKSVEDLGPPQEAGQKVLKQYLTEFMSTRLGVRRESNILSTSSNVADDGRTYYQVEVNIKSYASNNELAVMPQERVVRLEWDRRYLSVLGVENNRLYELRLQTPENVFLEEENDLRQVMDSFRVDKVLG
ncbi:psbP domain-containing protein 1, chloroplastic isoform X3 [Alnus glutinosa]|uniref:psbP domain-containing protein 1, chloroplastic isoform X3 n=1 Tax=Alnus glutinosa TaxID=3517 RepID=UPI002D7707E6|nr:psbP domain-containing protein 1, chloroplastic isoform X3 [Alnus glutinosa]